MLTCECGSVLKHLEGLEEKVAEKHGWRKISGKWVCSDCLGIPVHHGDSQVNMEYTFAGETYFTFMTSKYKELDLDDRLNVMAGIAELLDKLDDEYEADIKREEDE